MSFILKLKASYMHLWSVLYLYISSSCDVICLDVQIKFWGTEKFRTKEEIQVTKKVPLTKNKAFMSLLGTC